MISGKSNRYKAIPALVAGIAFFLSGCGAKVPVTGKIPEASVMALHQSAEVFLEQKEFQEALIILNRIAGDYPGYRDIPRVQYQIVMAHFHLQEYVLSKNSALEWLETYPGHSQKKEVILLLGDSFESLDNKAQAFYWFYEAKKAFFNDPKKQIELDERLRFLVGTSEIEDLEKIKRYAEGSHYAPLVRYRRAVVLLEEDAFDRAAEVSETLVAESRDSAWIAAGKALLERIAEEKTVQKEKIGCLLPLSGPFAIYGEEVLNGIQLSIFNGGASQLNIELVVRDTRENPEQALAGLEDLAHNEKVIAVIGPLISKTAGPVAARAQELGMPIMTLTQKEGVTSAGNMVFRNFMTPLREVKRVLTPEIIDRGISRFAILYPDNSYGRYFMNVFWDRIDEVGGKVTAVESYLPDSTDFGNQVKKMTGVYYPKPAAVKEKLTEMRLPEEEETTIYDGKPLPFIDFDAVFIPDNFQRVAMITPQLPYHDVQDIQLMGTSLWQSQKLVELASNYIQGAIFPSGFFNKSDAPVVKTFISDYRQVYGAAPGILAATGFDTMNLLKKILEKKYVTTRKNIRNELFRLQDFEGVTGNIQFDEQGELQNDPFLLTISGRRMRLVH